MKVLLDEQLPHLFRLDLIGHDVQTAKWAGLDRFANGVLLATAAADGFEVLVTNDLNLSYQQNLATLPLAVVVLNAPSNKLRDLRPLVPALLAALEVVAPRTLVHL